MVSRIIPVDAFDLVIFGGTGDLSRRKILPGLYRRFWSGQVPDSARIVGASRKDLSDEEFRAFTREAIEEFAIEGTSDKDKIEEFLSKISYVAIDVKGDRGWDQLRTQLRDDTVRAFYFSVGPSLFGDIAERLRKNNLADTESRIVVEKPCGHDLKTAQELNATLAKYFREKQIYRIDHYLGKETVQNLMAVRFGNILFEPIWNAHYVDHIQISVAETVGVGGRGAYYDQSGAMRDMIQNHLMQLLCLIAMEPPSTFEPNAVRDEKLKVIRALEEVDPHHIVRGQYGHPEDADGYRAEAGDPRSKTESFVAMKVHVNNWRWAGTPIYLRTGKKLRARESEIVVVFKALPHSIFGNDTTQHRNELSIRLQPNEGIELGVTIKEPGPGGMRLVDVPLDMSFADALGPVADAIPEAYERLIMDVIRGNQTLFMRDDEVEAAWAWTDPIIKGWEDRGDVPKPYDIGSNGPDDALALMHRDNRKWRDIKIHK